MTWGLMAAASIFTTASNSAPSSLCRVSQKLDRFVPVRPSRGEGAALHVFDGLIVHRHETGPGACLDRHVTDCQATLDGEIPNRFTAEFDGIAGTAGGADLADDRQHDILGGDPRSHLAVHTDQHRLGLLLDQALGGQDMFHLRGADAEGQGPQCPMGGGVGIAADHGHTRQGRPLLRPHHMDYALTEVGHAEFGQPELSAVGVQGLHLDTRDRVQDILHSVGTLSGRHIVIRGRQIGVAAPGLPTRQAQAFEGLG